MRKYLAVWVVLLGLTVVEVLLAYWHTPIAVMLGILVGLSFVKAGSIVAWFMHMAEERRRLAMVVVPAFFFIALILLGILPDAGRALGMGVE